MCAADCILRNDSAMDTAQLDIGIETLRLAAATGLLVLSGFCAQLLFMPDRDRHIRLPLALFFLASAVDLLALPVSYLLSDPSYQGIIFALELAEIPLTMAQPFLLWLYVYRLTNDPTQKEMRPRLGVHGIPIGLACVVYIYILLLPASLRDTIRLVNEPLNLWDTLAQVGLYGVNILFYAMVPTYAVLILRRLRRYRSRLKDLFASTERRELAWAWWLAIAIIVFWLFNLTVFIATIFELKLPGLGMLESLIAAILFRYALFWSIAIWGTRQRPGIVLPASADNGQAQPKQKYGNSGLSSIRLDRIAAKIEALMTEQHLYREPDLSLWDLAKQIGVTTHYASQALNEKIGECFFDYVNKWRVREAANKLHETDATILSIAYDVGFNSRSSFYTAFKSEFSMTPSQYRAS